MTKWWIKRLEDVDGKLNFEWSLSYGQKAAKWDIEKMKSEIRKMEIGEEKSIEI
jgi:hypothetical protein